jgi:hypothetical protein
MSQKYRKYHTAKPNWTNRERRRRKKGKKAKKAKKKNTSLNHPSPDPESNEGLPA